MGLLTVEGIYKDSRVELAERPDCVDDATRVLVTFLACGASREKSTVCEGDDRELLRQQAFARMQAGIHLGGGPYPKREELYGRPLLRTEFR
jgi:hypothetical protein